MTTKKVQKVVLPKGWGELPQIDTEGGFRMPTEREMREGLGPNFKPGIAPPALAKRFDDGTKDGTRRTN